MKFTLKIFLVVCLFSSVALADGEMTSGFADGEMGNGGKIAGEMTSGGKTDGEMSSGGLTADNQNQTDSILIFVQKYLISIFG